MRVEPFGVSPSRSRRQLYRRHPSGVSLATIGGVVHAVIVDQGVRGASPGLLSVVRASDGAIRARVAVEGPGQRFAEPLVLERAAGARLVVPSCEHGNAGPGHVEAWDAEPSLTAP